MESLRKGNFFVLILLAWLVVFCAPSAIARQEIDKGEIAAHLSGQARIDFLLESAESCVAKTPEIALKSAQEAYILSQESHFQSGELRGQYLIGLAFCGQQDYKQALDYLLRAADKAQISGEKIILAKSSATLGNLYRVTGDHEKSMTYSRQALSIWQDIGDQTNTAKVLNCMGCVMKNRSEYSQAMEYHRKAMEINEAIKDQEGIAATLNNMGIIYHSIGEDHQALAAFKRSYQIIEAIGDKIGIASALNNIGNIHYFLNQFDQALGYFQKSLQIKESIDDKIGIASSLGNIGNILKIMKRYDQALTYFQKAYDLKKEIGDQVGLASSLLTMSETYSSLGQQKRAMDLAQKASIEYERLGVREGMASALNRLGNIHNQQEQPTQALVCYQRALKIEEEIGEKKKIAQSYLKIGSTFRKLRDWERAEDHLQKGLVIAKNLADYGTLVEIDLSLSDLYENRGDYQNALLYFKSYHDGHQSLFTEQSTKQLNELQTRFEVKKREQELQLLKKDNLLLKQTEEVQKGKLQKQTMLRNSFLLGFILIAVIFVLLFKQYMYLFAFWKKEKYVSRYRLLDVLGHGGMSVVYRAHNIKEKKEIVAVKILKEEHSSDSSLIKRFKQEAMIIDQLDHPNIVKVFERGEDKKRLFIAMEYLHGKTLERKIATESPIPIAVCCHIMSQLANALTLIHSHRVIHRDLKPCNIILITRNGDADFVKILDFGLARSRFQSTLTQTGEVLGTIGYMSPEQLLDETVTAASDVYALGMILFEMVCNRKAFTAENDYRIIKCILEEIPPDPILFRPDMPMNLSEMIQQMIVKDPAERPSLQDVAERVRTIQVDISRP